MGRKNDNHLAWTTCNVEQIVDVIVNSQSIVQVKKYSLHGTIVLVISFILSFLFYLILAFYKNSLSYLVEVYFFIGKYTSLFEASFGSLIILNYSGFKNGPNVWPFGKTDLA